MWRGSKLRQGEGEGPQAESRTGVDHVGVEHGGVDTLVGHALGHRVMPKVARMASPSVVKRTQWPRAASISGPRPG